MIDLGQAANTTELVKDVDESTFMADVIEASKTAPVIVDFWAPWCGPCKTLGPQLEAEVAAAGGKVTMAKVDIDQNQMLASQMRVQSIPAVFAFVDGQPVDGFMGAKPQSEIKEFVAKIAAMNADGGDLSEALAAAQEMLEQGAVVDAAEIFAAVLQEDPNNGGAFVGLIKAQMAAGETDQARAMLDNAPAELASDPDVLALKARLELADMASSVGPTDDLAAAVAKDENDHQARYDLAMAQLGGNDPAAAIQSLLEIFKRDREWNEDAARQQLFKIFDSLGPKDEIAQAGRRKLASLVFL